MNELLMVSSVTAAADGGSYECVVLNDAGSGVAVTNLYVRPLIMEHPMDQEPRTGDNITLSCRAESFPYPEYHWEKLNNMMFERVTGADSNILELKTIEFNDFGTYRCCATAPRINERACSNNATVTGEQPCSTISLIKVLIYFAWLFVFYSSSSNGRSSCDSS